LENPDVGCFYFGGSSGRRVGASESIRGGSLFSGVMGRKSILAKGKTLLMKLTVALFPNTSFPFIAA